MLTYLQETLGFRASLSPWAGASALPLYLRSGREYRLLKLEDTDCLCIRVEPGSFRLSVFQKQLERLAEYWAGPVLLHFDALSGYQRRTLLEHRIPFVVPGSQLYFPTLGMMLQERTPVLRQPAEKLSPSAQLTFLYLLYQQEQQLRAAALPGPLKLSAMTVSRALNDLSALGLVQTVKSGRDRLITLDRDRLTLFRQALPWLQSPVDRVIHVTAAPVGLPLAGLSALAERTLLAPPRTGVWALDRAAARLLEPEDPDWKEGLTALEVWSYDPAPLVRTGAVDPLSLYLSLREDPDERVQQAREQLLEDGIW